MLVGMQRFPGPHSNHERLAGHRRKKTKKSPPVCCRKDSTTRYPLLNPLHSFRSQSFKNAGTHPSSQDTKRTASMPGECECESQCTPLVCSLPQFDVIDETQRACMFTELKHRGHFSISHLRWTTRTAQSHSQSLSRSTRLESFSL